MLHEEKSKIQLRPDNLPIAAWNNQLEDVKTILAMDNCKVNILNARNQSALYCAARQGHSAILLLLVNHKDINLNIVTSGSTALHGACFQNHPEAVAILLTAGANYMLTNFLQQTARQEIPPNAKEMLELWNLWENSNDSAIAMKYPIVKKVKRRKNKSDFSKKGPGGIIRISKNAKLEQTFLQLTTAAKGIQDKTAPPFARTEAKDAQTHPVPVTMAANLDDEKDLDLTHKSTYMASICEYVVDEGSQSSGGADNAREKISFFCQIEVKESSVVVTLEISDKVTPQQMTSLANFYDLSTVLDITTVLCLIIKRGEDSLLTEYLKFPLSPIAINMSLANGERPLLLAASLRNINALIALLNEPSVVVDQHNDNWDTALHVAARADCPICVALLLSKNADYDKPNRQRQTPRDLMSEKSLDYLNTFISSGLARLKTLVPEVVQLFVEDRLNNLFQVEVDKDLGQHMMESPFGLKNLTAFLFSEGVEDITTLTLFIGYATQIYNYKAKYHIRSARDNLHNVDELLRSIPDHVPEDMPSNLFDDLKRELAVVKQTSQEAVGLSPELFDNIIPILKELLDYCYITQHFVPLWSAYTESEFFQKFIQELNESISHQERPLQARSSMTLVRRRKKRDSADYAQYYRVTPNDSPNIESPRKQEAVRGLIGNTSAGEVANQIESTLLAKTASLSTSGPVSPSSPSATTQQTMVRKDSSLSSCTEIELLPVPLLTDARFTHSSCTFRGRDSMQLVFDLAAIKDVVATKNYIILQCYDMRCFKILFLFSRDAQSIHQLLSRKLAFRRVHHHNLARTLEEATLEMDMDEERKPDKPEKQTRKKALSNATANLRQAQSHGHHQPADSAATPSTSASNLAIPAALEQQFRYEPARALRRMQHGGSAWCCFAFPLTTLHVLESLTESEIRLLQAFHFQGGLPVLTWSAPYSQAVHLPTASHTAHLSHIHPSANAAQHHHHHHQISLLPASLRQGQQNHHGSLHGSTSTTAHSSASAGTPLGSSQNRRHGTHCAIGSLLRSQRPAMAVGTIGPVTQTIDMELQLSASLNCWNDLKHFTKKGPLPLCVVDTGSVNVDLKRYHACDEIIFLHSKDSPNLTCANILQQYESLCQYNQEVLSKEIPSVARASGAVWDQSGWRDTVNALCVHTCMIQEKLLNDQCVMIQSGGPDFRCIDSILTCLVLISLDPYYRTIDGFCELLRKEWFLEGVLPLANPPAKKISFTPVVGLNFNQSHALLFKFDSEFADDGIYSSKRKSKKYANLHRSKEDDVNTTTASATTGPTNSSGSTSGAIGSSKDNIANEDAMVDIHPSSYPFFLLLLSCVFEMTSSFEFDYSLFEWDMGFLQFLLAAYHQHSVDPLYETKLTDQSFFETHSLALKDFSHKIVSPFACSNREWRAYHEKYVKASTPFFADVHAKKDYHKRRLNPYSQPEKKTSETASPVLDLKHFRANKRRAVFELASLTPSFLTLSFLNKLQKLSQTPKLSLTFPLMQIPNEAIPYFHNVTFLALTACQISYLPSSFHQLYQLEALYLPKNNFSCIPAAVFDLQRLRELDMSNNKITAIPCGITRLTSLTVLDLESNRINDIENLIHNLEYTLTLAANLATTNATNSSTGNLADSSSGPVGSVSSAEPPQHVPHALMESKRKPMISSHIGTIQRNASHQDVIAGRGMREKIARVVGAKSEGLLNLIKLNLSGNQITELPYNLHLLSNLADLRMSTNPLANLPHRFICNVSSISTLSLSSMGLKTLPNDWCNLLNLTNLDLCSNGISDLPHSLCECNNLKKLNLEHCAFKQFPTALKFLGNLEILNLSHNAIQVVPFWIGKLVKLKELNLRQNQVVLVSAAISHLDELLSLDLSQNHLADLPHSIVLMKKLVKINLTGNDNEDFAKNFGSALTVVENAQEVKKCLRDQKKNENDATQGQMFVTSIMFLGPPKTGKNSIQQKLFNNKAFKLLHETSTLNTYADSAATASTAFTASLPPTTRSPDFNSYIFKEGVGKAKKEIKLMTWNFCDSRISEFLFPIFAKENSTNILVFDISTERHVLISQIKYWVLNICTNIQQARIIIVLNFVDKWRKEYPNESNSKGAANEYAHSVIEECKLQMKAIMRRLEGGLPFYLIDEKSETVHMDNLRARVIEAILAAPYVVELKPKAQKLYKKLEGLAFEKLRDGQLPVITIDEYHFHANCVGLQRRQDIANCTDKFQSNLLLTGRESIIVLCPRWLAEELSQFLLSLFKFTSTLNNFNGLFNIYEMKQILSYFSETNRPLGLYLLEKFHMCVTVTRGQSRFNHLLKKEEAESAALSESVSGVLPASAMTSSAGSLTSSAGGVTGAAQSSPPPNKTLTLNPPLASSSGTLTPQAAKEQPKRRVNTAGQLIPTFSDLYFYFSGALPETLPPKKQKNASEFKAIRRLEKEGKVVTLQRIFRLTIFSTALFSYGMSKIIEHLTDIENPRRDICIWNNHETEKSGLTIQFTKCTLQVTRKSKISSTDYNHQMKFLVQGHPAIAIPLFTKLITGHNEAMLKYKLDFHCFIKIGRRRAPFGDDDSETQSTNAEASTLDYSTTSFSTYSHVTGLGAWALPKDELFAALSRFCVAKNNATNSKQLAQAIAFDPNYLASITMLGILCECYEQMQRYKLNEDMVERKFVGGQIYAKFLSKESPFTIEYDDPVNAETLHSVTDKLDRYELQAKFTNFLKAEQLNPDLCQYSKTVFDPILEASECVFVEWLDKFPNHQDFASSKEYLDAVTKSSHRLVLPISSGPSSALISSAAVRDATAAASLANQVSNDSNEKGETHAIVVETVERQAPPRPKRDLLTDMPEPPPHRALQPKDVSIMDAMRKPSSAGEVIPAIILGGLTEVPKEKEGAAVNLRSFVQNKQRTMEQSSHFRDTPTTSTLQLMRESDRDKSSGALLTASDRTGRESTHHATHTSSSHHSHHSHHHGHAPSRPTTPIGVAAEKKRKGYEKDKKPRQLVNLNEFDQYLEDAYVPEIDYHGEKMNIFLILPEKCVPSHTGARFTSKQFEKKKLLGVGGFAEVFLVEHVETGEVYAMKELIQQTGGRHKKKAQFHSYEEFLHEIDIQGNLNHPQLLRMLGIIIKPFCILTEYCAHGDLYNYTMDWSHAFSYRLKLKLASDVAKGLEHLQTRTPPIAHIDLKGPNIFLYSLTPTDPVCAKIADFGTSQRVTQPITTRYVDNNTWQAPEAISGDPYTELVDTYAYAAVLWEMITRKRYLSDIPELDISSTILSGERPDIPPGLTVPQLVTIISRCWHLLPSSRMRMKSVLALLSTVENTDISKYVLATEAYDEELRIQREKEMRDREREDEAAQADADMLEREADRLQRPGEAKTSPRTDFIPIDYSKPIKISPRAELISSGGEKPIGFITSSQGISPTSLVSSGLIGSDTTERESSLLTSSGLDGHATMARSGAIGAHSIGGVSNTASDPFLESGLGMAGSSGMALSDRSHEVSSFHYTERDHVSGVPYASSGSSGSGPQIASVKKEKDKEGKKSSLLFHKIGSNPKDKEKDKDSSKQIVIQPTSIKNKKRSSSGRKNRSDVMSQSYASFTTDGSLNSSHGAMISSNGLPHSSTSPGLFSSSTTQSPSLASDEGRPHSPNARLLAKSGGTGSNVLTLGPMPDASEANKKVPCPCCGHETNMNAEPVLQKFDMTNFNCVVCGELAFQDDSDIVANIIPMEKRKKVMTGFVPFLSTSGLSRNSSIKDSPLNSPSASTTPTSRPSTPKTTPPQSAQRSSTLLSSTTQVTVANATAETTTTTSSSTTANVTPDSETQPPPLIVQGADSPRQQKQASGKRHKAISLDGKLPTIATEEAKDEPATDALDVRESRKERRKSRKLDQDTQKALAGSDASLAASVKSKQRRGDDERRSGRSREDDVNEHETATATGKQRKSERKKRLPLSPRARRSKSTERREEQEAQAEGGSRRNTVDIVVDEGLDLRRVGKEKNKKRNAANRGSNEEPDLKASRDRIENDQNPLRRSIVTPDFSRESCTTTTTTTTTTNSNSVDEILTSSNSNNNISRSGSTALEAPVSKCEGAEDWLTPAQEGINAASFGLHSITNSSASENFVSSASDSTTTDSSLTQSKKARARRERSVTPPLSPRSSAKHRDVRKRSKSGKKKPIKNKGVARDGYQKTASSSPNGSVTPDDSGEEGAHERERKNSVASGDETTDQSPMEAPTTNETLSSVSAVARRDELPVTELAPVPSIVTVRSEDPAPHTDSLASDDSLLDKPPSRPSPIRPSFVTSSSSSAPQISVAPNNTLLVPRTGSMSESRDSSQSQLNAPTSLHPLHASTHSVSSTTLAAQVLLQQQLQQQQILQSHAKPSSEGDLNDDESYASYDSFKRQLRKINSGRFIPVSDGSSATGYSNGASSSPISPKTTMQASPTSLGSPAVSPVGTPVISRTNSRKEPPKEDTVVIVNSQNEEVEIITTLSFTNANSNTTL